MTYAFPFMNRFYGKSGLLNMIIFSVSALLIDGKCVMLLLCNVTLLCGLYSLSMLQISHLVISHLVIKLKKLSQ